MRRENSGKREHQKIKPYIVLEYLMKNSDESHAIPIPDIKYSKSVLNISKTPPVYRFNQSQ